MGSQGFTFSGIFAPAPPPPQKNQMILYPHLSGISAGKITPRDDEVNLGVLQADFKWSSINVRIPKEAIHCRRGHVINVLPNQEREVPGRTCFTFYPERQGTQFSIYKTSQSKEHRLRTNLRGCRRNAFPASNISTCTRRLVQPRFSKVWLS